MFNKNMKYLLVVPVLLLLLSACDSTKTTTENIIETELLISSDADYFITFSAEGKEVYTADVNKTIKLLTTQASYNEAVIKYEPKIKVDDLNFSSGNVLLIDMGKKGAEGYIISTKVVEIESYLLVNIEYCTPHYLANAESRPHQFIWIPSKKEIEISETNIEKLSCL